MKVGVILPQGWTGEYDGWDARDAWARTVELAGVADELGFESVWLFDHFHTTPNPTEEITFESFSGLAALAALTRRVRLGHLVSCAGYRNPAVAAKTITTIDVISGGRADFALGAGWKQDEWRAYGFGFPSLRERQARLADALEIATRMFAGPRATYEGETASVADAINVPQPIQKPRIPIIVGGNGRDVTWRLAARYADELNLDNVPPDEMPDAMRVIRERCEEIGRDPATLRLSVHLWTEDIATAGQQRVDKLGGFAALGVNRVQGLIKASATDDEALDRLIEDARAAGVELG